MERIPPFDLDYALFAVKMVSQSRLIQLMMSQKMNGYIFPFHLSLMWLSLKELRSNYKKIKNVLAKDKRGQNIYYKA